jgi:hypothetical protein
LLFFLDKIYPKLSDYVAAIIVQVAQGSGGDKSHPYLLGETSFVVAGFIPAWKGLSKVILGKCRQFEIKVSCRQPQAERSSNLKQQHGASKT